MVIVASALAGVTDSLIDIAKRAAQGESTAAEVDALRRRHIDTIGELLRDGSREHDDVHVFVTEAFDELERIVGGLCALRELTFSMLDSVVARGERIAARLLTVAFSDAGIEARYVDALEVIRADDRAGNASPDLEASDAAARKTLLPLLRRGVLPVVPGFIALAPNGQLVTLGRGGSDLTATVIGRALGAAKVVLWKDVPGILTADPRAVPEARVVPQLNVREAAELAYAGAKVLHPRALIPLGDRTRVFVRPFADPAAEGTEVSTRRTLARYPVKAISAASGQALVTITGRGMLGVPGVAARTFAALHRGGISVSLISQASSEQSICLAVPEQAAVLAERRLLEAFADELHRHDINEVTVRRGLSSIAIVGLGMAGVPGIASRLFAAIAKGGINVVAIAQGASEFNVSFVVDSTQAVEAQRRVHAAFQLDKIGGGAALRGNHTDVVLLGFGQIGRELTEQLTATQRSGHGVRVVGIIDRSGYVFEHRGLSGRRVRELARAKAAGIPLRECTGGIAATPEEALERIGRHALSRPLLVDVTAADTGALLEAALGHGIDLVLANKRPLAGPRKCAESLFTHAMARGRRVFHEATVGAGLPIIDTYHKLKESGDDVLRIEGCPSGTLGFLLGELGRGTPFSAAVRDAMRRGYTEPDPRDDLSGMDVARKALILGRLLGFAGELDDVKVESLVPASARGVTLEEFLDRLEEFDAEWEQRVRDAAARGKVLRYRATATKRAVRVGLVEIDAASSLASLTGTDNQFSFTTQRYSTNPLVITGPGAGREVTAAGVFNDVLKARGE